MYLKSKYLLFLTIKRFNVRFKTLIMAVYIRRSIMELYMQILK